MGRKCCVPGCTSNYNHENSYTTVFKFPSIAERRKLWIHSINRDNFEPSATAVVCINHFEERFIIREDRVVRDDGTLLVVPRKKLGLTSSAYPTKFENQPSYLSKKLPAERKSPSLRREEIVHRDEENFVQWCAEDEISSFEQFIIKFNDKLTDEWHFMQKSDFVVIYRMDVSVCPKLIVSFKVHMNLTVEIWHENMPLDIQTFEWLLGKEHKCDKWTKFDSLISHLLSYGSDTHFTLKDNLSHILKCLENSICDANNDEICSKLKFIKQQILLLSQKQNRYSTDTILWSAKVYFTYPAAYNIIRDSKVMTLPHPCYLKKLSSFCNTTYSNNGHIEYLKKKSSLLGEHEKIVNILLDEIYVNPIVTYKAGCLIGVAENSNSEATTILAFMSSSILSKNKDIVALFPVRNLTSDILLKYTKEILKVVSECDFIVLALISDNNRINRNMFTSMCGGNLKSWIPHPFCNGRKMFFMFDSVHLVKSIRNNWFNQTATNQIFYFPSPVDGKVCCANLMDLKTIHDNEKNSVVKLAPKLSRKVLYPSSIEKQNVNTALNVFHITNSVALEMNQDKLSANAMDTKLFIDYIANWWKIMNVKHPFSGQHQLDDMLLPIKSLQDKSFVFLQDFSHWVQKWNELSTLKLDEKKALGIPGKGGMLSKETFCALQLTMHSAMGIVKYMFESLSVCYIMLGKFQTDHLEARFGQYRQMSGGNYNISCQQIYESEKKLKILNLISLYSQNEGKFQLKDLEFECPNLQSNCEIPECFYDVFNSFHDVDIEQDTMSCLIYIAGYIGHKVCYKLTCKSCISYLIADKALTYECSKEVFRYLKLIDRGALKWPQELLIFVTVIAFQIFQKLIGEKFEDLFVQFPQQKALLIQLVLEKLELLEVTLCNKCSCGSDSISMLKKCLSGLANIFHNNYIKLRNDKRNKNSNKRKISTFNL